MYHKSDALCSVKSSPTILVSNPRLRHLVIVRCLRLEKDPDRLQIVVRHARQLEPGHHRVRVRRTALAGTPNRLESA